MFIKEKLAEWKKLVNEINEYFGGHLYGEGFDDHTHYYWNREGNNIVFDDDLPADEWNYSNDICGNCYWEKEEYTLVKMSDGCGNDYYGIFDNSKKVNINE